MSPEVEQFITSAKAKKTWSDLDFLNFCRDGIRLAKEHRGDRSEIAYAIVEEGRYFGDFSVEDKMHIRQEIRDLAAELELPDAHVDTSDGLSVDQKWSRLEALVSVAFRKP